MKKNKKERLEKKDWAVGDTDDFLNDESLEEVMASDFPRVYVHDIKDNPDESCSMEISTNKAFDELFKKEKNRKRVSNKGIQEFFTELLEKGLAKEDGYDLKTLDKRKSSRKSSKLYK